MITMPVTWIVLSNEEGTVLGVYGSALESMARTKGAEIKVETSARVALHLGVSTTKPQVLRMHPVQGSEMKMSKDNTQAPQSSPDMNDPAFVAKVVEQYLTTQLDSLYSNTNELILALETSAKALRTAVENKDLFRIAWYAVRFDPGLTANANVLREVTHFFEGMKMYKAPAKDSQ
jgi:hypothetical protein